MGCFLSSKNKSQTSSWQPSQFLLSLGPWGWARAAEACLDYPLCTLEEWAHRPACSRATGS